jgi:isoleucyl-tRNA synthetase
VTDRIILHWRVGGSPDPAEAIREHSADLSREVLAIQVLEGAPATPSAFSHTSDEDLGLSIWLARAA